MGGKRKSPLLRKLLMRRRLLKCGYWSLNGPKTAYNLLLVLLWLQDPPYYDTMQLKQSSPKFEWREIKEFFKTHTSIGLSVLKRQD